MQGVFSRRMSRKEFLIYVGVLFLTVSGVSSVFKKLSDPNLLQSNKPVNTGFGKGSYGS